jgi:uncharacterized protein (TIGR02145 family)
MRFSIFIMFTFFSVLSNAQAPALIPYQAVARDAAGQALNNATINVRFTIHDGAATGAVVWQELQTVTTTELGLFTVQLGSIVPLTGVSWANGTKFMQVEIDLGQGFVDMGTQQLLSVPYALYGNTAGNGIAGASATGDTLYLTNGNYLIVPGLSAANNGGGTSAHSCGALSVHNPDLTYGSMTDQEGNVYKTIVIGTQEWMAENLNTSIYRNGDAITTSLDNAAWTSTTGGAWTYYNNDVSYACPYGKLYNWHACVDARQLCPVGWHVPTDADWSLMINFLDPLANGGTNFPNSAGGKMKSIGTIQTGTGLWYSPNQSATNSSGFSGFPGGGRGLFGVYAGMDFGGYWWSSSDTDAFSGAWYRDLGYPNEGVNRSYEDKQRGYSVRCLRD